MPPPVFIAQLFLPTGVALFVALIGSRIVYRLSLDAGKAREMGSYRLVNLIGRGGMGEVWRAEHRMLARPAAIKLIRPDGAGGREALARFEREAQATATLRSPHTVQLYDFGLTEEGAFYSVMELLDGFPLDDLVDQWGPLPPARTVHVLLGVCRSLREAHALGLVHRDIKPGNVFLCRSGTDVDHVKVLDFGLVKETTRADSSLTQTGFITGTPGFMAPEMALGRKEIDGRADLYSLGCVGFYLLTGETVFEKRTPIEVLMDHAKTPPPRPSQKANIAIPEDLEDLLMDCLAKEPNERPESAHELERRLWGLQLRDYWTPAMAERWWAEHASALRPARAAAAHDPRPRTAEAPTHLTAAS
jgi:serine/threonine-protein kinase